MNELHQCDALIRQGRIPEARRTLSRLPFPRLRRADRLLTAQIARRVSRIELGLRLLHPVLHPKRRGDEASEEEKAEYAALLSLNGSSAEGLDLLPRPRLPQSLLAKAWCLFEIREFGMAVPLLRSYVARQKDPYYRAMGQVNLAEALSSTGEGAESLKLLTEAIAFAAAHGHRRLHANALHVRARALADRKKWKASNEDLESASKLFGSQPTADAFLIRRQIAMNQALERNDPRPLHQLRSRLNRFSDGETLRELDYQLLRLRPDPRAFAKLYCGTPHEEFRRRLREALPYRVPGEAYWGTPGAPCLDLATGKLGDRPLLAGQSLWLLRQLLDDFYAPQSLGRLFAGLYPGERYHWNHSPNRVHQGILRLRRLFRAEKIPLEIEQKKGRYLLRQSGAIRIRVPAERPARRHPLERLRADLPGNFSAMQARDLLGISKSNLNRILRAGADEGLLELVGKGRSARYRWKGLTGPSFDPKIKS